MYLTKYQAIQLKHENQELRKEVEALRALNIAQSLEIETLKRQLTNTERDRPINLYGWYVFKQGKYYRLYKRIEGKVVSVYLGTELDEGKAKVAVERKLKQIYREQ
jgi:hypothetical protein